MDQPMEKEQRKGARYGTFVDCGEHAFDVGHRQGFVAPQQLAQDEQSRRRGFDVMTLEKFHIEGFVLHHYAKIARKNGIAKLALWKLEDGREDSREKPKKGRRKAVFWGLEGGL